VSDDFADVVAQAEQALADDAERYALTLIEPIIAARADARSDAEWNRVYAVAQKAWAKDDKPELAMLVGALAHDRRDPSRALRLGHALIDAGFASMASGVLSRALSHQPADVELLHELVASLELQGRYAEAAEALEIPAARPGATFLTRYLRAFNSIASGHAGEAAAIVTTLAPGGDARFAFMRARLDGMLQRSRVIGASRSPRGDELVLSGALLLEDEAVDYREESWATIAANIVRLRAVLEALDRVPSRVVSLQASRQNVVCMAAATLLGARYEARVAPDEGEGMVANHDLAAAFPDVAKLLAPHRRRQLYYAHSAAARAELPVCSDVIGVRGERIVSPWDLYAIVDYTRTDLPPGPPTGSDEELAHQIVSAAPAAGALADVPALVEFARRAAAVGVLALTQEDGQREKLWPRAVRL
jgi:hypothetical protein